MTYTESQAESLREAPASAVLTAEHDGTRFTYCSVAELEQAQAEVEAELTIVETAMAGAWTGGCAKSA